MKRAVSEQVHNHFRRYEVEYLQFAFRWMNNLLMRELPLRCTIRLWDTYQVGGSHHLPTLAGHCGGTSLCVERGGEVSWQLGR